MSIARNNDSKLGVPGGRVRANLSAWLRERTDRNAETNLTNAFLGNSPDELGAVFWSLPPLTFHDKANNLLITLEKHTNFAGDFVTIQDGYAEWIARAWAMNMAEFEEIIGFLVSAERIDPGSKTFGGNLYKSLKILPLGWMHLEELHKQRPESQQGFIAMRFKDSLKPLSQALHQAIESAGYAPLRIDQKDHVNRIDDQIQVEIKSSRFVVADLTEQNQGVYFEAGYALGLGIPVIWTCNKQELDDKKAHFDVRQYNCLDWEPDPDKLDDFKDRLCWRIENVCGRGRAVPLTS